MTIVVEALCITLGRIPPKQKNGTIDYWSEARVIFGDPNFLKQLQ